MAADTRLRLLADALPGHVYEWDVAASMVEGDAALPALLGFAPDAVAPDAAWWDARIHPDDLAGLVADARARLADPTVLHSMTEYRVRHRDGTWRWVADRACLVRDRTGRVVRVVGITSDVTPEREQRESLARAELERRRHTETQEILAAASPVLGQSLDLRGTALAVARAALPAFADWAVVDALGEDGRLAPLAHDAEHLAAWRAFRVRSCVAVPLEAPGERLGVLRLFAARGPAAVHGGRSPGGAGAGVQGRARARERAAPCARAPGAHARRTAAGADGHARAHPPPARKSRGPRPWRSGAPWDPSRAPSPCSTTTAGTSPSCRGRECRPTSRPSGAGSRTPVRAPQPRPCARSSPATLPRAPISPRAIPPSRPSSTGSASRRTSRCRSPSTWARRRSGCSAP